MHVHRVQPSDSIRCRQDSSNSGVPSDHCSNLLVDPRTIEFERVAKSRVQADCSRIRVPRVKKRKRDRTVPSFACATAGEYICDNMVDYDALHHKSSFLPG